MGFSASQARLLSVTARLSDNEHTGQGVSYSKQRLADQTEQITASYNEALNATKLTVLTGFNGSEPSYTDISYNLMTSPQMAVNNKQYVITDNKGKVLVTKDVAKSFETSSGDYNKFLAKMGYSQTTIAIKQSDEAKQAIAAGNATAIPKADKEAMEDIHGAWDKYFSSVGITLGDKEHDNGHNVCFSWTQFAGSTDILGGYAGYLRSTENIQKTDANGLVYENGKPVYEDTRTTYAPAVDGQGNIIRTEDGDITYAQTTIPNNQPAVLRQVGDPVIIQVDGNFVQARDDDGNLRYQESTTNYAVMTKQGGVESAVYDPINYEGSTKEQRALYDYAVALTEAYLGTSNTVGTKDNNYTDGLKNATDSDNVSMIKYYKNIFEKMLSSGYYCYTDTLSDSVKNPESFIYKGDLGKTPIKDDSDFEAKIRSGELCIEYFSTSQKKFVSTTISDDQSIQEVKDERKMVMAETQYTISMNDLERKDKRMDMELKKLDTEHSALQTEYDSIKSVIDKNIEKSFSMFS